MRRHLHPSWLAYAGLLLLLSLSAMAQVPPIADPGTTPPDQQQKIDIEPILPSSDALFQRDAWVELGRDLGRRIREAIPRILAALLVLGLFYLLAIAAIRIVRRLLDRSRVDPAVGQLLLPLLKYSILGLGLIMALSQAGFNVGSLLAGVGVAGLAVGLAAQDTLANIVAGFTILSDRPFRIGDRVTVAGWYGQIVQTGMRSTRIRTLEQLDVVLPNKDVIDSTIVNHTMTPNLRLGVPLSIAYKESAAAARKVLLDAAREVEGVRDSPEPEVVVTRLADSGVELELRVWLEDPQQERQMLYRCLENAKEALDAAGIEIPFPQRTLHFAEGSGTLRLRTDPPDGDPASSSSSSS